MTLRDFVEFATVLGIAEPHELEAFETGLLESASRDVEMGGPGDGPDLHLPLAGWLHCFRFARRLHQAHGIPYGRVD